MPKVHVYPGPRVPGAARPARGRRRPRALRRARPVHRRRYLITVHGPLNPAVDPRRPPVEVNAVLHRLDSGRLQPTRAVRAVPRAGLRADRAAARLHRRPHPGRLDAGTAGHRRASRRPGAVPRRDVPRPARAADRQDDGRAVPRGLRPDGQDPRVRRRAGPVPHRGHHRPVRPAAGDGRRAEGLPAGHDRVLPGPHQHQDDHRRRAARRDRRGDAAGHRAVVDPRA